MKEVPMIKLTIVLVLMALGGSAYAECDAGAAEEAVRDFALEQLHMAEKSRDPVAIAIARKSVVQAEQALKQANELAQACYDDLYDKTHSPP
jgi:hypothetical protein